MINKLFSEKLTPFQIDSVVAVCGRLQIPVNWLLFVMYFETGKTLKPSTKNGIGSVGLIQFTRDKAGVDYKTINGKKYFLSDLANMTFTEQILVVEQYYLEVFRMLKITKVSSLQDLYFCTFFPLAVGKSSGYVLETKNLSASKIAGQNPIFDRNKDGKITKSEIDEFFEKWIGSETWRQIANKGFCITCGNVLMTLLGVGLFFYTQAVFNA